MLWLDGLAQFMTLGSFEILRFGIPLQISLLGTPIFLKMETTHY